MKALEVGLWAIAALLLASFVATVYLAIWGIGGDRVLWTGFVNYLLAHAPACGAYWLRGKR